MTTRQGIHKSAARTRDVDAPSDESSAGGRAGLLPVAGRARAYWPALVAALSICSALLGGMSVFVVVRGGYRPVSPHGIALLYMAVLAFLLVVVVGFSAVAVVVASRPARGDSGSARGKGADSFAGPVARPSRPAGPANTAMEDNGVFVHLSQRLQSLVHRQIGLLDALENDVEDPDLLKGLFDVDHLATRMRRHAENLAVLGGAIPRRQWTRPISVTEVLRSSVSETLNYARVQVIAREASGAVKGYVVADVVHLVAELVENATAFSPPETKVVVRTQVVAAGLAVEVDDRGLGMDQGEYDRLNALLKDPSDVSVRELLEGARIGLFVVARLARRHGIAVRLQPNITGGTQALVVLPTALLAVVDQRPVNRPAPPPGEPFHTPPGEPIHTAAEVAVASGRMPEPWRPPVDASGDAGPAANASGRPQLPRRRPQEHLAASLMSAAHGGAALDPTGPVVDGPSPMLMADFRRGLASGAAAPAPGTTAAGHDHVPIEEGAR